MLLVRHADAGDRQDGGPDAARPLSGRGREQAAGLIDLLAPERLERVFSSPAVRCRDTVAPLAAARGLAVEEVDWLQEGCPPAEALARICSLEQAVCCSHGDVVAGVILALTGSGVELEGGMAWQKASTWALAIVDGAVVAGRYIPPPRR